MKRIVFCALSAWFLAQHAFADGDVFLCVDENGKKEYRNVGTNKGCKRVELPGLMTVPAPARRPASNKTASAPANFPKVDEGTQKARDSDRKQILLDELKSEEEKLARQKKEFNNGEPERLGDERNFAKYQDRVANMRDEIGRTEKNIDALKRELGNIK